MLKAREEGVAPRVVLLIASRVAWFQRRTGSSVSRVKSIALAGKSPIILPIARLEHSSGKNFFFQILVTLNTKFILWLKYRFNSPVIKAFFAFCYLDTFLLFYLTQLYFYVK